MHARILPQKKMKIKQIIKNNKWETLGKKSNLKSLKLLETN